MRGNGSDKLVGELKDEETVGQDRFWSIFNEAKKAYAEEPKDYILLRFLPDFIPLLQRWKYARLVENPLGVDEINTWCKRFKAYMHSMPEAEAGDEVVKEWTKERAQVRSSRKQLVKFLEKNRP